MKKSAFIRARIEPEVKKEAEKVLEALGITPSQAITMLYKRVACEQEWPIELKVPNAETKKAFEETDKNIGLVKFKTAREMFKALDI